MSRGRKIALIVGGSLAGLLLLVAIAGVVIVQTALVPQHGPHQDRLRGRRGHRRQGGDRVVHLRLAPSARATCATSCSTGWNRPAPRRCFRANLVQVDLKLLSPFKGFVDIAYLLVDTPQANVIVFPDGRTNIPAPKLKKPSDKSGLETIVDLAIGQFDLLNSSVQFAEQKTAFNATGQNLRAHLAYNPLNPELHRRDADEPAGSEVRRQCSGQRQRQAAGHDGEGQDHAGQRGADHAGIARSSSRARWTTWSRRAAPRTSTPRSRSTR